MKKIFIFLLSSFLFMHPSYANEPKAIYSLPIGGDSSVSSFVEFTKYINKRLNLDLKTEIITNYYQAANLIFRKEALFGFICSGPYVILKDKYNLEALAAIKPSYGREYRSYLIVPMGSGAKSIKDLKGKKFAFVDALSYTGRITAIYEILKMKEDPLKFFSEVIYSKTQESAIKLVAEKKVDGAAVMNLIFENIAKRDPSLLSKVLIIEKSAKAGYPVFVTSKFTDPEIKDKLKNVFLNMHKDPQGKMILNSLEIEQLIIPNPSDYKIIEEQVNVTKDYIPF